MKTINILEEEKLRILKMHKNAISKQYLMEQVTIDPTISQALDNLQKQFESMIGLVVSKYPEQEGYAERTKKQLSEDISGLKNLSGKFDSFSIVRLLSYKKCYGGDHQAVNGRLGLTMTNITNYLNKKFESTPQNVKKVVRMIESLIEKLQRFQFLK